MCIDMLIFQKMSHSILLERYLCGSVSCRSVELSCCICVDGRLGLLAGLMGELLLDDRYAIASRNRVNGFYG
jgi:hypothetical protein